MTLLRGIDTDNYDGAVSVARFRNLYDNHGVRFNIIGLEAGMPYAQVQKDNAIAAGLLVPFAYKFLYWDGNDLDRMKKAASFGVPIAIDCEYATDWDPKMVVHRIHEAKDALVAEGMYWGIYTGAWWWPAKTNNNQDFADDPLWHAAYPFGDGVLPPEGWLPDGLHVDYGGWQAATVMQYADVCYDEPTFDMNAWQVDDVPPTPPRPPYVTHITQTFSDGTKWELDVVAPPGA